MKRTLFGGLGLALSLSLASTPGGPNPALAQAVPAPACSTPAVPTSSGPVCGLALSNGGRTVNAYLGIPYAETTAGANRFRAPVPKAAQTAVRPTTAFGPICPQNAPAGITLAQSEDCLSVNVWTPGSAGASSGAARLPVLVFIHGGAFVTGSSADPFILDPSRSLYDGSRLAGGQNMVVVTFNYRLGALGFLAGVAGLKGNFGFLDQQLALEWVRDNIARFGGDPARVTLSGESAGAMSVGLHLLSAPRSAPLFRAALMESNPLGLPYKNLTEAARGGEYYLSATGCRVRLDQAGCLRAKPVADLLAAQKSPLLTLPVFEFGLYTLLTFSPVVDGEVIVTPPLTAAANGGLTKPTLLGTNANEGTLFLGPGTAKPIGALGYQTALVTLFGNERAATVLRGYPFIRGGDSRESLSRIANDYFFLCATRSLARAARAPAFVYDYTHVSSLPLWPAVTGCPGKSCHGDELPFVFGAVAGVPGFTPEEQRLSQALMDYWGRFVADGNPGTGDGSLPAWPAVAPGNENPLRLDTALSFGPPSDSRCGLWDGIGYGRQAIGTR